MARPVGIGSVKYMNVLYVVDVWEAEKESMAVGEGDLLK